jgi:hypothetical protein
MAKRNRSAVACVRCKAGKNKCSDYRPCRNCWAKNVPCKETMRKCVAVNQPRELEPAFLTSTTSSVALELPGLEIEPFDRFKPNFNATQERFQHGPLSSSKHVSPSEDHNISNYSPPFFAAKELRLSISAEPSYPQGGLNLVPFPPFPYRALTIAAPLAIDNWGFVQSPPLLPVLSPPLPPLASNPSLPPAALVRLLLALAPAGLC